MNMPARWTAGGDKYENKANHLNYIGNLELDNPLRIHILQWTQKYLEKLCIQIISILPQVERHPDHIRIHPRLKPWLSAVGVKTYNKTREMIEKNLE